MSVSLIDPFALPGMGTALLSTENTFVWGTIASWQIVGVVIKSTAVDSGNSPTTTLRKGLVLGALGQFQLAPGVLVRDYGDANTDGSQFAVGILLEDVNLLDGSGVAANKYGRLLWFGNVKAAKLFGLTLQARRQLNNRIIMDDGFVDNSQYQAIIQNINQAYGATTGAQTVVAANNNNTITTEGGTGAVTFTLPALATVGPGWRIRFFNAVDQNMVITAPSNTMIQPYISGSGVTVTGTTATFSTSSQKIGAACEIVVSAAGTKYYFINQCANTVVYS